MAKQRPTLGVFANPVSTMVQPIEAEKTIAPLNQQAIRDSYAFAEMFGQLSESAAKVASIIKTEMNQENLQKGKELVDSSRKTYAELVRSGKINPSENPWTAVGAQQASGVLEASRARADLRVAYDKAIAENPALLKDNDFVSALASSYAERKAAEFGNSPYLSDSFFDNFNPAVTALAAEHAGEVGKYRTKQIVDSLRIKVNDILQEIPSKINEPRPTGEGMKDEGFLGLLYDLEGNTVTEKSITFNTGTPEEFSVPMIVPGLSLEGKEAIVYNNASYDELSPEDQSVIMEHARKRISEGKSPFFGPEDRIRDRLIPELQQYMDEQGQNIGMPRVTNLSTAMALVDAMKNSSQTYEAEQILRSLKAGTGMLADTQEVKTMLLDAAEDIAKNRSALQVAQDQRAIGTLIEQSYQKSYNNALDGKEDADYGAQFDQLDQLMDQLPTTRNDPIARGKMHDQFNERWNNARRQGEASLARADRVGISAKVDELVPLQQIQSAVQRGEVIDWGRVRTQMNDDFRNRQIAEGTPRQGTAVKEAGRRVDQILNAMRQSAEESFPGGLAPRPNDPNAAERARRRQVLKLNELMAAQHFGLESRGEDVRRIAISGISVDIERGLRPELMDLISVYRNFKDGRGSIQFVVGTGDQAKRTIAFLDQVDLKMRANMDMSDAARDAQQALNMTATDDVIGLWDLSGKAGDDLRETIDETLQEIVDSWAPFGWFDYAMNPDSVTSASSMFLNKFSEEMRNSNGAIESSMEKAQEYVYENTMFVNGSIIPKDQFPSWANSEYIQMFITAETGKDARSSGQSLVWVGNGANGQPVFALRTPEGNRISDRYYTIDDITSDKKPRDDSGEVIKGSLSPKERAVQVGAEWLARKEHRIPIENLRPKTFQPNRGAMK